MKNKIFLHNILTQYLPSLRGGLGWGFCFFFISAFSQKEANIWYFGRNAGLDFNSGSPVAITNGQLYTDEGCATLSDNNGNLLFYTDGRTIYNKNHLIMLNGSGLMGHSSSSQSATIVPKPGSSTLFFVFTVDYEAHPNGLRYSVIDLTLDSGLGGVTAEKNVLVVTPTLENLGVTKHANGIDFWIVTSGINTDAKYAYVLSSSGLNLIPVVSNIGTTVVPSGFVHSGYLKFAPSGTKLAMTSAFDFVELFDFDNSTGIISNTKRIYSEPGELYGVEFSPNEQLLYISNAFGSLYQFNLAAANITSSKISLDTGKIFGALQIGPDNKIYSAVLTYPIPNTKLSVINNPDVVGLGCGYQYGVIDLAGKECREGLPAFNQSFFNPSFKAVNLCLGDQTHFTLTSTQVITGILWDFGDGFTSTALSPNHQYATAGNFTVTVTVTTATFGTVTKGDTVSIASVPVAMVIPNKTVCGTTGMLYDLTQHNTTILGTQSPAVYGVAYFGSLTNLIDHSNIITNNFPLVLGNNILYAKIYNKNNPVCYDYKIFTINFGIQPIANVVSNSPIMFCDTANDNIENFNLGSQKGTILGSQSATDFTVSYHFSQADANTNSNPLPSIYTNTSNPQTIFVRVTNNANPTCYDTTSFVIGLYQMPVAIQPTDLTTCDDTSNDGKEIFNLVSQTATILGTQSLADFTVSYHATQPQANSGANPLPNNFTNTTALQQTIYIRVTNNLSNSCFDASKQFTLNVKPKPQIVMNDSYSICEGTFVDIPAPSGWSSYSWSKGSTVIGTQPTIRITVAGNYSLTVTKNYGTIICSDTKLFTVNNSNKAKITKIDINDWTENENTIEVFADGDGIYEYSLDNHIYQDSPVFTGLGTGQYTVFVNDKKGCSYSFKEIFLLTYPKFFTPNGDGTNDYWRIKFSETEPNLTVKIFNRYGTLIKELRKNGYWNGTDNSNNPLNSDDYWFVVTRQDGKVYKGHFALMR